MIHQILDTNDPNIFTFICECPGSGVLVLVHEIPDKEPGVHPDKDYANWYFCNRINLSAHVLETFQGMLKFGPEYLPVPLASAKDRDDFRKVQAKMLRDEGFTDDQVAVAIGVMCEYAHGAWQSGYCVGIQTGLASKPRLKKGE